ncbi:MAG: hypothetical protein S4CHLAM102_13870 [Chlamydiia bacterium]|nr:hypothetical protein [Chlamydiia bacterium]
MPIQLEKDGMPLTAYPDTLNVEGVQIDQPWFDHHKEILESTLLKTLSFVHCPLDQLACTFLQQSSCWQSVKMLCIFVEHFGEHWSEFIRHMITNHPQISIRVRSNDPGEGLRVGAPAMLGNYRTVNLSYTGAQPSDFSALAHLLTAPATRNLDLSGNCPNLPQGIPPMLRVVQKLKQLNRLFLTGIGCGDSLAEQVSKTLKHSQIVYVDLEDNHIGPEGAKHLIPFIRADCHRTIRIKKNPIGPAAAQLGPLLMQRADLVDLGACQIDATTMHTLTQAVRKLPSIEWACTKLNLSKNPLGDQGGKSLLQLLTHLSNLELGLEQCQLNESIPPIFQHLVGYQKVISFALNRLTDEYLSPLWVSTMKMEKRTEALNLCHNQLTILAIEDLAKLLFCHPQMEVLDFSHNDFSQPADISMVQPFMAQLIRQLSRRVKILDFSGTNLQSEAVAAIGMSLVTEPSSITTLYLSNLPPTYYGQPMHLYFPSHIDIIVPPNREEQG